MNVEKGTREFYLHNKAITDKIVRRNKTLVIQYYLVTMAVYILLFDVVFLL